MSQAYGGEDSGTPYWLSATGVKDVRFIKQASPPLASLNQGILYELNDGVLYYNGTGIAPTPLGNVTSTSIPSVTNSLVKYADTTGMVVDESVMKVVETPGASPNAGLVISDMVSTANLFYL